MRKLILLPILALASACALAQTSPEYPIQPPPAAVGPNTSPNSGTTAVGVARVGGPALGPGLFWVFRRHQAPTLATGYSLAINGKLVNFVSGLDRPF